MLLASLLLACEINPFSCGFSFRGVLPQNGCNATFAGHPDDTHVMVVEMRPLWKNAAQPRLEIVPPAGESIKAPAISGAGTLTLRFLPTSQQPWTIVTGSDAVPAPSDYFLGVSCAKRVNVLPSLRSCVYQELSCNQTIEWSLQADSCEDPVIDSFRYIDYIHIVGIAGDVLDISMESQEFTPRFWIENDIGTRLSEATVTTSNLATISYRVPATGSYWIA